jgi:hypothetical protein
MPLIIYFGLDDRVKRSRHSRNAEPEVERRNPIAILPPRRDE